MRLHEHVVDQSIRAGDISRHKTHQRPSPLKAFTQKMGAFDLSKVLNPIHVVSDNDGKWLAIDGATRVEACIASKKYGPDTKLPCKVYGNGSPPTGPELDELFLVFNADQITVSAGVAFERAVGARREDAVSAQKQIERLGPLFRTTTTVWNLVKKYGDEDIKKTVTFVLDVWGAKKHVPGAIISAVAFIFQQPEDAKRLLSRVKVLRKTEPDSWLLKARNNRLRLVGQRDAAQTYVVTVLLGRAPVKRTKA